MAAPRIPVPPCEPSGDVREPPGEGEGRSFWLALPDRIFVEDIDRLILKLLLCFFFREGVELFPCTAAMLIKHSCKHTIKYFIHFVTFQKAKRS